MLKKALNKYISAVKGEAYVIDARIPGSYLSELMLTRLIMKLRGKLRFAGGRGPVPFIGASVTIKARSAIKMGSGVSIGSNCILDALSTEGIVLGNNVSIGNRTVIECTGNLRHIGKGLKAGDNAGLGSDNFYGCAGGIDIGSDTIVGNFVSFHSENHNYDDLTIPIRLQGVTHHGIKVGSNCWIGAKSTILDGAILEDGCIIAAGAVVKSGIYVSNGIYGGVPAKLLKHRGE